MARIGRSSLQPCAVLNFCQASPEKAQQTKRHCGNPDAASKTSDQNLDQLVVDSAENCAIKFGKNA